MLETIEAAITLKAQPPYRALVSIDGIDKKKATELTNALRLRGIKLELIRKARDESEPIIRLADMWAGCIRSALLKAKSEKEFFERAQQQGYLIDVRKEKPPKEG